MHAGEIQIRRKQKGKTCYTNKNPESYFSSVHFLLMKMDALINKELSNLGRFNKKK